MASPNTITAADIRSALDYDPLTGVFTWRERPAVSPADRRFNSLFAGKPAGSVWHDKKRGQRYVKIQINGQRYRAHRLAWIVSKGPIPDGHDVDHRNGDSLDNRLDNLRPATRSQNIMNSRLRSDNTSGLKGVSYHPRKRKHQARITLNGRTHSLGYYDTAEEAYAAYRAEAARRFGPFARAQ